MFFISKKEKIKRKKEKYRYEIECLELKMKKEAYKKSINSGKFSKRVIEYCIMFTSLFGLLSLYVQYKTGYDTSSLLRIIAAVFGGELLMLLFKRLWSNSDTKTITLVNPFKNKKTKNKSDSIISSDNELNKELTNINKEIDNDNLNIEGRVG